MSPHTVLIIIIVNLNLLFLLITYFAISIENGMVESKTELR